MKLDEKIQTSQFILFAFLTMAGVLATVISFQLNGVKTTISFLQNYSVPLAFLGLLAISVIPIYNETHHRIQKIASQFGFSFIVITLASFMVWTHAHFVNMSAQPPFIQIIYGFASKLWYITGIGIVASAILGVRHISTEE